MEGRQLPVVVGERVVDRAERLAGRHRLHLAGLPDVPPESDDVAAAPVRTGIEQIGGRHDRRAGTRRMGGNRQLADHVLLRRPLRIRPPVRDTRDDRERPQVDEDVPGVAENDRVVAAQPVLARHLDGCPDGALAHPNPYVPGNRSASSRTSTDTGRPTTLR